MVPVLGSLMILVTGCADYKWVFEYDDAVKQATEQKKTLFIYYRYWLNSDCTTMYNEVLSLPDVTAKFQNTINCQLEYGFEPNQQTMANYGVRTVPGFVIVRPDGSRPATISGLISKERFVRWAESAMRTSGGADQKPKAPPPPPERVAP